ncbi:NPCBM/NEW2 domain-containing protein [Streptomyces sp. NPDC086554]|uniref:NPCBM/NEW2 domain-containing protein n=1 Tax=Streptomyces sp. NPDC086554 TaxID=3154864 RepID=UPI00342B138B
MPLTDVDSLGGSYVNWAIEPATMGGKRFDDAITIQNGNGENHGYRTNERYKSLTVTVGLDDDSAAYPATVTFLSGGGSEDGGKTLKTVTAQINRPVKVTVDLTGVAILTIEGNEKGDAEYPRIALGDPVLHRP